MRYGKLGLASLALWFTVACGGDGASAPPTYGPPIQVAGDWLATGELSYGGDLICYDTLAFTLTQDDDVLASANGAWRYQCGTSHSDSTTTPMLVATGSVRGDSVGLVWRTAPDFAKCPSCGTLFMLGRGDSAALSGRYEDFLGGSGTWSAARR